MQLIDNMPKNDRYSEAHPIRTHYYSCGNLGTSNTISYEPQVVKGNPDDITVGNGFG